MCEKLTKIEIAPVVQMCAGEKENQELQQTERFWMNLVKHSSYSGWLQKTLGLILQLYINIYIAKTPQVCNEISLIKKRAKSISCQHFHMVTLLFCCIMKKCSVIGKLSVILFFQDKLNVFLSRMSTHVRLFSKSFCWIWLMHNNRHYIILIQLYNNFSEFGFCLLFLWFIMNNVVTLFKYNLEFCNNIYIYSYRINNVVTLFKYNLEFCNNIYIYIVTELTML